MRFVVPLLLLSLVAGSARAQQAPTYVIFFQEWSAALDGAAQGVITNAAAWAKAHPDVNIHVVGFADPTGSRKANILLSELRAQIVVDGLTGEGVGDQRITPVGQGSVQFALTSQESRRVTVSFGPP
jgi:outer membrane protein OmpA-like peptidoglycan-associated protein